jgi:Flp pilus assembly protein TadG
MRANVRTGERGQALPLIILMFVVLCGCVGLTIDVGFGLLQKRRLQAAVDLGALSGAQQLPGTLASSDARSFTRSNFALASAQHVNVDATTSCMVAGCAEHDRLRLTASTQTPTFFVKLFGVDEWTVTARGAACGPCDSSVATFDVMVVLDRSGSMSGTDMANARTGIRELLEYFDDDRDRVGLTLLESADSDAPSFDGAGNAPCEADGTSYSTVSQPLPGYVPYGGSNGAFMDGSSGSHDDWVVVDLAHGTDFKNANGTLNENSTYLDTLDCVQDGGSTPIGPAVYEAANELDTHGRDDAVKVMVYIGDGGASSMPMQRQCRQRTSTSSSWQAWRACVTSDGAAAVNQSGSSRLREWRITGNQSWYPWSSGNRDRPCADAIAQSARAKNLGYDVYAIGYGVSSDYCMVGTDSTNHREQPLIRQSATIEGMASAPDKYFAQPGRGDITDVFSQIGRDITAGGTRLVE